MSCRRPPRSSRSPLRRRPTPRSWCRPPSPGVSALIPYLEWRPPLTAHPVGTPDVGKRGGGGRMKSLAISPCVPATKILQGVFPRLLTPFQDHGAGPRCGVCRPSIRVWADRGLWFLNEGGGSSPLLKLVCRYTCIIWVLFDIAMNFCNKWPVHD